MKERPCSARLQKPKRRWGSSPDCRFQYPHHHRWRTQHGRFPLAGLVPGFACAITLWAAMALGLPPLAGGLLALAAAAVITGALHEDGLADCGDALAAPGDRARRLEIMRDSRIGAHGGLALIVSVGLRASALAALGMADMWWTAGLALAAARASTGSAHAPFTARPNGWACGLCWSARVGADCPGDRAGGIADGGFGIEQHRGLFGRGHGSRGVGNARKAAIWRLYR